jgi:hypothetical protein
MISFTTASGKGWAAFYERAQQYGAFGGPAAANLAKAAVKAFPNPPVPRRGRTSHAA